MSITVPTEIIDGAATGGVGGYVVLAVTFTTAISDRRYQVHLVPWRYLVVTGGGITSRVTCGFTACIRVIPVHAIAGIEVPQVYG